MEAEATTDARCAARRWHPGVECVGDLWLVRLSHPLLGAAWSCLPHAIHAVGAVPDISIIDVPDETFADEIKARARAH
jgi:hypothetical protein